MTKHGEYIHTYICSKKHDDTFYNSVISVHKVDLSKRVDNEIVKDRSFDPVIILY